MCRITAGMAKMAETRINGQDFELVVIAGLSGQPMEIGGGAVALPATIKAGQVTIAATNVAQQLPSNTLVNGVRVKSKTSNNPLGLAFGPAGVTMTTGDIIEPGESISYPVSNTNGLWVAGTIGDVVSYGGN